MCLAYFVGMVQSLFVLAGKFSVATVVLRSGRRMLMKDHSSVICANLAVWHQISWATGNR